MQDYISQQSGSPVPVVGRELWKSWLSSLLSGIEFLHDSGILHNDIKPQNILLTNTLQPYISDFAVSTPLHYLELPPSPDLHILGTTVYTAPELLLSGEDVPTTPASDIYSLGISMFVAATGQEPFSWTRSVTQKIMMKKRGDIFAGTEVRMPQRMMEIIKGMCASDPSRRWDYTRIRRALNEL
jgi:serine/threonine protein kinase